MHCCRAGNVQELDHRMGILVVADMKFCIVQNLVYELGSPPTSGKRENGSGERIGLACKIDKQSES